MSSFNLSKDKPKKDDLLKEKGELLQQQQQQEQQQQTTTKIFQGIITWALVEIIPCITISELGTLWDGFLVPIVNGGLIFCDKKFSSLLGGGEGERKRKREEGGEGGGKKRKREGEREKKGEEGEGGGEGEKDVHLLLLCGLLSFVPLLFSPRHPSYSPLFPLLTSSLLHGEWGKERGGDKGKGRECGGGQRNQGYLIEFLAHQAEV